MKPRSGIHALSVAFLLVWAASALAYDLRQGNLSCIDCHLEGSVDNAPGDLETAAASPIALRAALSTSTTAAWSGGTNLSNTSTGSGLCSNTGKALAVDGLGNLHAVWHDKQSGSWEVYHAVRSPTGAWSTPERLTPADGRTSAYPSVAAGPGGRVCVVWEDYLYTTGFWPRPEVLLREWDGAGWSDIRVISGTAPGMYSSWFPSIAVGSDDRVHVLWQDRRLGPDYAVFRGDETGEVGLVATDGARPSVGAGGGRILAAWETSSGAIVGQELDSWSPQTLAPSGAYASVHVNATGTGYAVWNTPAWDVGYAAFENGAWGSSGEAGFSDAYYPSVAVDAQGNPHVAFGYGTLEYSSMIGASWAAPETIESSDAGLPILTAGGNALQLAYIDTSGGNSEVYYRARPLATRNPVLFIPGFMASKLYHNGELIWVDPPKFIWPGDTFLDPLEMDTVGADKLGEIRLSDSNPGASVPPSPEDWDQHILVSDFYAGLFNAMVAAGYTPSADTDIGDFTYFAYDWRRAPDEPSITAALETRVQQLLVANSGATQVDVVTHSTGGLVLKPYLQDHPDRVGKVIMVAAPHLGVARGFRALQFGQIELGWLKDLFVNENELMKISQNWLGPYALSPSQGFFNRAGYGPIFQEANVDLDKNGAFDTWDWSQVDNYYRSGFYCLNWYTAPTKATDNPHSEIRAGQATTFHDNFDSLSQWLDATRDVALFVGQNLATLKKMELSLWDPLDETWPDAWTLNRQWMGGDGTVPTRSASVAFDNSRTNVHRYYVWNVEHSGLLDDGDVAAAVAALLRDEPPPLPDGKIQRDVPFRDTLTLWEIIFHCPLEVHVYDPSGNHTGPSNDRQIERGIEGVQYERFSAPDGFATTVLLPQGKHYEFVLVSKGVGEFRLTAHKIDDDVITQTTIYDQTPLEPATTGLFSLPATGELGNLTLDLNGDGSDVRSVPPGAQLVGDERADRDPPVTVLSLAGTPGLEGYYISDVEVILTSSDGPTASGVRFTQYSLGGRENWTRYEGVFTLAAGCAIPVRYRSQDLNYNVEAATEAVVSIDQAPPVIASFAVTPGILWPPNHKMVEVVPSVAVTDNCTAPVAWAIESIRMNEGDQENTYDPTYDQWLEQGFMSDDIQVIDDRIYLRAERGGSSDGRTYTLTLAATDDAGNVAHAQALVVVPHDQR